MLKECAITGRERNRIQRIGRDTGIVIGRMTTDYDPLFDTGPEILDRDRISDPWAKVKDRAGAPPLFNWQPVTQ